MSGNKKKRPSFKKLVRELDKEYSLFIRQRDEKKNGACYFHCGRPIQDAFHIVTRARYVTRWDPDNGVGSCKADNFKNEFSPHPYVKLYIEKEGLAKYNALVERSQKIAKFSRDDLEAMLEDLRTRNELGS